MPNERVLELIGMLLELLQTSGMIPDQSVSEDLETLTRFAVATRYPPENASAEDVDEALLLARNFIVWVESKLPAGFI